MSEQNEETKKANRELVITVASWVTAIILSLGLLTMLLWQPKIAKSMEIYKRPQEVATVDYNEVGAEAQLPTFVQNNSTEELTRDQNLYTEGQANSRLEMIYHTVVSGDSIWALSQTYNVEIESILFANYDVLQDKSDNLMVGQVIAIPPVDGIYHTWRSKDTLSSVASRYGATIQDILLFIGNNLDLSNPKIEPGTKVMVPGGRRVLVPISYAAVTRDAEGRLVSGWDGPGACLLDSVACMVMVSHLAFCGALPDWKIVVLDTTVMTSGLGLVRTFAADSGTVVYAGWMNGGYVILWSLTMVTATPPSMSTSTKCTCVVERTFSRAV